MIVKEVKCGVKKSESKAFLIHSQEIFFCLRILSWVEKYIENFHLLEKYIPVEKKDKQFYIGKKIKKITYTKRL